MNLRPELKIFQKIPFLDSNPFAPKQLVSESWEDRRHILERDMNLFCWRRPVNESINNYLEKLLENDLPTIRFHTQIDNLEEQIKKVKVNWGFETNEASELFWMDVLQLSKDFLTFSKDRSGIVHLKVISDDACRKFHIDGYSLRLFSTYYGKGTEWLPEKAVNRSGLGKTNKLIVKDSSLIQRMNAFDVGILKGELPSMTKRVKGIVHRSPQINEVGEKRIILRIDI